MKRLSLYAAYMLAYSGIRLRHTAIDTAFRTLVLSLVATAALALAAYYAVAPLAAGPIALVAACVSGLVSRKWGRRTYYAVLLHWTAAGMMEAKAGFRRLKAYRQFPALRRALAEHLSRRLQMNG